MSRDVISDEAWAVIGPLFPAVKATGRPPVGRRRVAEATAWRFRTGAPWRDVPQRFGNRNTICKNFNRWAQAGVWARLLEKAQPSASQAGELDWIASIDSTTVRVHQHGATLPRDTGGPSNYKKSRPEPADHAIGRPRGGLTTKNHLVCDGKGRASAPIPTPGQAADASMLTATPNQIRAAGAGGRPRTRPDRLLADKGHPSRANRAWPVNTGSPPPSPNVAARSPIGANVPAGPSTSAMTSGSATRAATSPNAASTNSNNDAGSRCAPTRQPATTTPASASPQPSTGPPAPS